MLKRYITFAFFVVVCSSISAQKIHGDSASIQQLPSIPFLPDPLLLDEGGKNIPVKTPAQWHQKRQWIREQYQYWVSGSVPPSPGKVRATVLHEKMEGGMTLRMVELRFAPDLKAKMTVELMIPTSGKRFPVFMTQWNHRGWAQVAVRRGYIGCVFAGADAMDDTRNYNELFPGFDFATLMKRAWGSSRVIDYLYTLPEVDTAAIALTGHSRNGKQSLMAAAFDERIKAVVSSSGGTGGENTFRWSDNRFTPGSFDRMIENVPDWFNFRLPWFIGREQKLPVDQNSLMSLIAPRGLMMVSAVTEHEGNPWGIEQSFQSVRKVYQFLHADSNLSLLLRPGRHQHAAREAESFMDFFDYVFGRSKVRPENKLFYNYSFEQWKQRSGERIDPLKSKLSSTSTTGLLNEKALAARRDRTRQIMLWLMGEEPPAVHSAARLSPRLSGNSAYPDDYLDEVIGETPMPADIKKMTIGPYAGLGDNLWAAIYFPSSAVMNDSVFKKMPLVIFLHEYAYATGYHRKSIPAIAKLTRQGFAVLAFDMMGFGSRIEEAASFYQRYPRWTVMGKMVADTRGILNDVCTRMPFIDSANVYLAGHSLGGTVALFTAALDQRVKGIAVVNAFSSLRNPGAGTEGVRLFSHLHGLLPRLGLFVGNESRIPLDFDDILSCIAPRSMLVIAAEHDRNNNIGAVREMMSGVSNVYSAMKSKEKLKFEQPRTYGHFPDSLQQQVAEWLLKE